MRGSATLAAMDFAAFGTTCRVATSGESLTEAIALVSEIVRGIDEGCSRFRPDSDLSRVNRNAGEWVTVGPMFLRALDTALRAARITNGDLDPTIGASLSALGYHENFADLDTSRPHVVELRRIPGWRTVEVDSSRSAVRIQPGSALDFGATAKALAADLAAERVASALNVGALVSMGGDIALAGRAPQDGWRIDIAEHHASTAIREQVVLDRGAIATSTTTARTWATTTGRQHHIVDPRTQRAADVVWRTVSVIADSCVDANIAATTAIIRGEGALTWLQQHRLDAYLMHANGWSTTVGRWPEDQP